MFKGINVVLELKGGQRGMLSKQQSKKLVSNFQQDNDMHTLKYLNLLDLQVSTHAVIGQFSRPYSPAQTAKI